MHEYKGAVAVPILIASLQSEFKLAYVGSLQFLSFNIGINSGLQM